MLKGYVFDHWETGMEDSLGWAFQDGRYVDTNEYGKPQVKSYNGFRILRDGDYLEMVKFNPDTFYWKGVIEIGMKVVDSPFGPVRSWYPAFTEDKKFLMKTGSNIPLHNEKTGKWYSDIDKYIEENKKKIEDLYHILDKAPDFKKHAQHIEEDYELVSGQKIWYHLLNMHPNAHLIPVGNK